jgi:hypothetical protein
LGVVKGQGKKKLELAIEINNNKYEKNSTPAAEFSKLKNYSTEGPAV